MSTIEKAAAKLAAKRRAQREQAAAGMDSVAPPRLDAEVPGMGPGASMQHSGAQAGAEVPVTEALSPASSQSAAPGQPAHPVMPRRPIGGTVTMPAAEATPPHRTLPSATAVFRVPPVPTEAAELDLERLKQAGFLTPKSGRSAQAQEFRRVKRQLLNRIDRLRQLRAEAPLPPSSFGQSAADGTGTRADSRPTPPNVVMVTSALAGEGKTYVTTNLAMSLSQEVDRAVLLIDGDIAKADITRNFGLTQRIGLGEVLKNPGAIHEAYLSTNVPRLSVMASGRYHENLDELFASELMEEFVFAVADQNPDCIVLFDAPPLLVATEATVLARHVSQILLVVEANRTPKDAVTQALSELHGRENISLLLNKCSMSSSFGYGYGYGYGYGNQNADPSALSAAAASR